MSDTPTPEIIMENDEVIVVSKPVGMLVHPDGSNTETTLSTWISGTYSEVQGVGETLRLRTGEEIERPGIVHRLDQKTSGVMVVARTQESFEHLKDQFKKRLVKKTYRAFIYGTLKEREGTIDLQIGKSRSDFRKWSAEKGARGKKREARTAYTVLNENETIEHAGGKGVSYIEARPETGRTHQIRVHFKALHHPVLCDSRYAPNHECLLGFTRLALHAHSLSFTLLDGVRLTVEAPLPEDFVKAREQLSS